MLNELTLAQPWKPCYCSAYDFPHRMGGGNCEAQLGDALCCECGKANSGHWVRLDEGKVEFWGTLSHENRRVLVSDCCESEMRHNESPKE
jgi:hypothetical protein